MRQNLFVNTLLYTHRINQYEFREKLCFTGVIFKSAILSNQNTK